MKTEFRRDLKNNYLVIEPEGVVDTENYAVRMIEQNTIQGLLPMQVRKMDGVCYLYYEITSRQQLDSIYRKHLLCCEDIQYILSELQDILESVRKYLLDPKQILFDPQYMYVNAESQRIGVCYYPVEGSDKPVLSLAEFILKNLDHEDSRAVSLGYGFYQKASEPNFSLSDTLREILAELQGNGRDKKRKIYNKAEYEETVYGEEDYRGGRYDTQDNDGEDFDGLWSDRLNYDETNKVYHKDRKKWTKGLFQIIHPAILLLTFLVNVTLGILLYLGWLGLTETGGIFFFTLSAAILANRYWRGRREKRKKRLNEGRYEREEIERFSEEMQELRSELYRSDRDYKNQTKQKNGYDDNIDIRYDDPEDKTRCLSDISQKNELYLISEWPEKYPDIHVGERILIVGKKKNQADIILEESTVSRIHARVERHMDHYYVKDLNSRNGTYVNGVRINPQEQYEIKDGDKVAFANVSYRAVMEEDSDRTRVLR